jgi:hypothetical protein
MPLLPEPLSEAAFSWGGFVLGTTATASARPIAETILVNILSYCNATFVNGAN